MGWVGAGSFSTGTLLPAFQAAGFDRFTAIASASGLSSRRAAERYGFARAVSGGFRVVDDPDTSVVVIATPHDTHAELAMLGPEGRAARVVREAARADHGRARRRDARLARAPDGSSRSASTGAGLRPCWPRGRSWPRSTGPMLLVYRVAAGPVPDGHWYHDPRQGGRILGEVCHFVDTAQALIGSPIEEAAGPARRRGGGRRRGGLAALRRRVAGHDRLRERSGRGRARSGSR